MKIESNIYDCKYVDLFQIVILRSGTNYIINTHSLSLLASQCYRGIAFS